MAYIWPGISEGSTSYPSVIDQLGLQVERTVGEVEFPGTNLITNGDFSAGKAGWVILGGTVSTSNNILTLTGSGTSVFPQIIKTSSVSILPHKYYKRVKIRTITPYTGTCRLAINVRGSSTDSDAQMILNPVIGQWYELSSITDFTAISPSGNFMCVVNSQYDSAEIANGKSTEVQRVFSLDLTERFGEGNEPTAAEMDAIMSYYPNSWFDGTENLAQASKMLPYLLSAIRAKADKAQEAWITPTLTGGATASDSQPVGYYKDSVGNVHLRGMITCPNGATVLSFQVIAGYRPAHPLKLAGISSGNAIVPIVVFPAGTMWIGASSSVTVSLDGIFWRGEQ